MTNASERIEGQPAFALHSRPYRETSAIVDFITEDFGRIALLVKGVRQAKSKQRIATQSFSPLSVSWTGRGELKTLTQVESAGYWPMLAGRALCCGMYLNELMVKLLPVRDPSPRLFAIYRLTLQSLPDAELEESVLRIFEHRLLDEIGLAPSFSRSLASSQPIQPHQYYDLQDHQGFSPLDAAPAEVGYLGEHLLAIAEDDYSDLAVRRAAKRIMRQLIQQQLGGKVLASRALFANVMPPVTTSSVVAKPDNETTPDTLTPHKMATHD